MDEAGFCASVEQNFRFSVVYLPGAENVTADALSRLTELAAYQPRFLETFLGCFPGKPLPTDSFSNFQNHKTWIPNTYDFDCELYQHPVRRLERPSGIYSTIFATGITDHRYLLRFKVLHFLQLTHSGFWEIWIFYDKKLFIEYIYFSLRQQFWDTWLFKLHD